MNPFSYTSLFTGPTCDLTSPLKIAQLEELFGWDVCMFYSSKIHNIRYIPLKQTLFKTPGTLKKTFAVVILQTKQLAIIIKVVRNQDNLEGILQFWENYTIEHSVLKNINVTAPTMIN